MEAGDTIELRLLATEYKNQPKDRYFNNTYI